MSLGVKGPFGLQGERGKGGGQARVESTSASLRPHLPAAGEGTSVPPQAMWGVLAGAPSAHPNEERGSLSAFEELSPGHTGLSRRCVVGLCLGVLTDRDGLTAAWRTLLLQSPTGVKVHTELTSQDTRPPCSSAGRLSGRSPWH